MIGSRWKSLEVVGSRWKSLEVVGSRWQSLEVVGSRWKSLEVGSIRSGFPVGAWELGAKAHPIFGATINRPPRGSRATTLRGPAHFVGEARVLRHEVPAHNCC